WAYLAQVHGLPGAALGWLPARLAGERARAAQALDRFIQTYPSAGAAVSGASVSAKSATGTGPSA
ncbi:MAG TPA: hypothetical protein PK359_19825, partial [Burkholderiaceae bacterium]|nr:hypothetical protein [Burkholderiaceae bacterium]